MVQVDDSFNGREVTLQSGETLEVTLSENPSTGFRWVVPPELKSNFEKVVREHEQTAEGSVQPPGKPGVRRWYFQAIGAGTGELELHYRRPWENKPDPARRFQLRVIVRE